jgi:hypothetical protein
VAAQGGAEIVLGRGTDEHRRQHHNRHGGAVTAISVPSVYCDDCGIQLKGADERASIAELRLDAHRRGWATYRVGDALRDLCPSCDANRQGAPA